MTEQEQIEVLKQRIERLENKHENLRLSTQAAIDDLTKTLARAAELLYELVSKE